MSRRATRVWATRTASIALVAVSVVGAYVEPLIGGLVSFAVMGLVVLWRRPDNVIGWLLSLIGSGGAIATVVPDGSGTLGSLLSRLVLQVNSASFGLVIFLVLLFPTGRLPSPR